MPHGEFRGPPEATRATTWPTIIIRPLPERRGHFEEFAETIGRHWDCIAAYCGAENKVSLGFIEGPTNQSGCDNAAATG